jgi:hypothetical protein
VIGKLKEVGKLRTRSKQTTPTLTGNIKNENRTTS